MYLQSLFKMFLYLVDLLKETFPYLIGIIGIVGTFYTVHKTIKHEKEIAQAQITSNIKRKWIGNIRKISARFNNISSEMQQFFIIDIEKETLYDRDMPSINKLFRKMEVYACLLEMYLSTKIKEQDDLRTDIRYMIQKLSDYFIMIKDQKKLLETTRIALNIIELSDKLIDNFRDIISNEENRIDNLLHY